MLIIFLHQTVKFEISKISGRTTVFSELRKSNRYKIGILQQLFY